MYVERGELWNRKGTLRDRRGTVEGSLCYMLKISKLLLFVDGLCNVQIIKWYVVVVKKAQRRHIEGRMNAGMFF